MRILVVGPENHTPPDHIISLLELLEMIHTGICWGNPDSGFGKEDRQSNF